MITVEVNDDFTPFLNGVKSQISVMRQTLIDIAHLVELNTKDKVPFRTGALEHSYKWNIHESSNFIELEMGYSSLSPKGFDYAYIQHEANFNHPIRGEQWYLFKGFSQAEDGMFVELESDFLSLFG